MLPAYGSEKVYVYILRPFPMHSHFLFLIPFSISKSFDSILVLGGNYTVNYVFFIENVNILYKWDYVFVKLSLNKNNGVHEQKCYEIDETQRVWRFFLDVLDFIRKWFFITHVQHL